VPPRGAQGESLFRSGTLPKYRFPKKEGNRHIPSASFASPSVAPLTADVVPSTVLFQGRHDAASETSRSPAVKHANASPPAAREASCGWPRGRWEKAFFHVTGERALSFRDVSLGETAASPKGGMRRGQGSPGDTSQKRPVRSLGTEEMLSPSVACTAEHSLTDLILNSRARVASAFLLTWSKRTV